MNKELIVKASFPRHVVVKSLLKNFVNDLKLNQFTTFLSWSKKDNLKLDYTPLFWMNERSKTTLSLCNLELKFKANGRNIHDNEIINIYRGKIINLFLQRQENPRATSKRYGLYHTYLMKEKSKLLGHSQDNPSDCKANTRRERTLRSRGLYSREPAVKRAGWGRG